MPDIVSPERTVCDFLRVVVAGAAVVERRVVDGDVAFELRLVDDAAGGLELSLVDDDVVSELSLPDSGVGFGVVLRVVVGAEGCATTVVSTLRRCSTRT